MEKPRPKSSTRGATVGIAPISTVKVDDSSLKPKAPAAVSHARASAPPASGASAVLKAASRRYAAGPVGHGGASDAAASVPTSPGLGSSSLGRSFPSGPSRRTLADASPGPGPTSPLSSPSTRPSSLAGMAGSKSKSSLNVGAAAAGDEGPGGGRTVRFGGASDASEARESPRGSASAGPIGKSPSQTKLSDGGSGVASLSRSLSRASLSRANSMAQKNALGAVEGSSRLVDGELVWQGEEGKKFVVLRGGKIVMQSDFVILRTLLYDVRTTGRTGCLSLNAFKNYISTNSKGGKKSAAELSMAGSIAAALSTNQKKTDRADKHQHLTALDILELIHPNASPEEFEFIQKSYYDLKRHLIPPVDGALPPIRELTTAECKQCVVLFNKLDEEDSSSVSVGTFAMRGAAAFPDVPEQKVLKQLSAVLPRTEQKMDLETLMAFFGVHYADFETNGGPHIGMGEWIALMDSN